MWLLEWPRLKKLYTTAADSERAAQRECFAIKKTYGAGKVNSYVARRKRCVIEEQAAEKGTRRLASETKAS